MKNGLQKTFFALIAAVAVLCLLPFIIGENTTATFVVPKGYIGWFGIIYSNDPHAPIEPPHLRVEIPASGFAEIPYQPSYVGRHHIYRDASGATVPVVQFAHTRRFDTQGKPVPFTTFFVGPEESSAKNEIGEAKFVATMLKATKHEVR